MAGVDLRPVLSFGQQKPQQTDGHVHRDALLKCRNRSIFLAESFFPVRLIHLMKGCLILLTTYLVCLISMLSMISAFWHRSIGRKCCMTEHSLDAAHP